jgi:hypothetical protein
MIDRVSGLEVNGFCVADAVDLRNCLAKFKLTVEPWTNTCTGFSTSVLAQGDMMNALPGGFVSSMQQAGSQRSLLVVSVFGSICIQRLAF